MPLYPPISGFFVVDVAGFSVCLVLNEYVVFSLLIEHVQCFQIHVGCSQRVCNARGMYYDDDDNDDDDDDDDDCILFIPVGNWGLFCCSLRYIFLLVSV